MRGRHSLAVLKMMGIEETVANSIEDYIRIAVRLGKDLDWRRQVSQLMRENASRAYRDLESIRGLEKFLEDAVAARTNPGPKRRSR